MPFFSKCKCVHDYTCLSIIPTNAMLTISIRARMTCSTGQFFLKPLLRHLKASRKRWSLKSLKTKSSLSRITAFTSQRQVGLSKATQEDISLCALFAFADETLPLPFHYITFATILNHFETITLPLLLRSQY